MWYVSTLMHARLSLQDHVVTYISMQGKHTHMHTHSIKEVYIESLKGKWWWEGED